jgi:hypothetical protein
MIAVIPEGVDHLATDGPRVELLSTMSHCLNSAERRRASDSNRDLLRGRRHAG